MKRHPEPIVLLVALSLLAWPGGAAAYPISPVSLWQLVAQADLVVIARVERVGTGEPADPDAAITAGFFDRDTAVLRVLETWKGSPLAEVRVSFGSSVICPAPPRYVEGEIVLAFLERGETRMANWREAERQLAARGRSAEGEDGESGAEIAADETEDPDGGPVSSPEEKAAEAVEHERQVAQYEAWAAGRWFTVGLSYGTLYPDAGDRPTYRALVDQAVRLQAAGTVAEEDRREWLVSAAERRATRWQGLYDLAPSTDALHSFYDRPDRREQAQPLSAGELERLARGFVAEPSVDGTLPMMLALLSGDPDREVDRAAAAAIEAALRMERLPWWFPDAMARVFARFGDADPARRMGVDAVDCEGLPIWSRVDAKALPGIWEEARRELRIPDVRPAAIPDARVRGVGGETPD